MPGIKRKRSRSRRGSRKRSYGRKRRRTTRKTRKFGRSFNILSQGIGSAQFSPRIWRHTPYSGLAASSDDEDSEFLDEDSEGELDELPDVPESKSVLSRPSRAARQRYSRPHFFELVIDAHAKLAPLSTAPKSGCSCKPLLTTASQPKTFKS